ncbi:MAG: hypothetical protein Q9159_007404, partial [Coniocarpon cinnabarinum]
VRIGVDPCNGSLLPCYGCPFVSSGFMSVLDASPILNAWKPLSSRSKLVETEQTMAWYSGAEELLASRRTLDNHLANGYLYFAPAKPHLNTRAKPSSLNDRQVDILAG